MKLGIMGAPQSGKKTIFNALTGARGSSDSGKTDPRLATITVHDERIKHLRSIYNPQKTIYAKTEYMLPSPAHGGNPGNELWNQLRICDALIHVVRNFTVFGGTEPNTEKDFFSLEEELIINDLAVVEKRIERMELDRKRGKKPNNEEAELISLCHKILDKGAPLRSNTELASHPLLKGYTFLSAKPMLVVINNSDEDESLPAWKKQPERVQMIVLRGKLEQDIATMSQEEANVFIDAYNIKELAIDRIIKSSYNLMRLISFFTVGADEVKAWTIVDGTIALDAAEVIHSDIKKGFIRAEVLAYNDFLSQGNFNNAKKAGLVRLEGKEYKVMDGDIINFRFNV